MIGEGQSFTLRCFHAHTAPARGSYSKESSHLFPQGAPGMSNLHVDWSAMEFVGMVLYQSV